MESRSMERESSSEKPRRRSVFREVGLLEEDDYLATPSEQEGSSPRPPLRVRFKSKNSSIAALRSASQRQCDDEWEDVESDTDVAIVEDGPTPLNATPSDSAPPSVNSSSSLFDRLVVLLFLLAITVPIVQSSAIFGSRGPTIIPGAEAGPTKRQPMDVDFHRREADLDKRADSPTDVCKRWGHHSAVINGTLFLYGGRATTSAQQTDNQWNNNLVSLDLTRIWQIGSPPLKGLPQPSGPPAVSLGYLWNSYDSLYLYGGEYSENPQASPGPNSLWQYDIKGSSWKEHKDPKTSAGEKSEDEGETIQRAAEGAGFSLPALGRGWFFGGHLDFLTTQGWSNQVERVYLKSFVEYTFPGFGNPGIKSLGDRGTAGADGAWRNITNGGIQETAGFTNRADGILTYIPGFGAEGILIALAGGDNQTFTQMNVIDVYDIATSTWYKQATTGSTPKIRVNPCAVVAAAADGSSYNVYMFGGQNLVPYKEQIQYDDMWILSVPSFTWIQVDQANQPVPPARAGHTCNIWDGQMVVVGGYVGQDLSCDSPGIYVFNASSLKWNTQYTALSGASQKGIQQPKANKNDPTDGATNNPFSQQMAQRGANLKAGLQGSYGYAVPPAVYKAIGGGPAGGATLTVPVQHPTSGPLATGKPQTYTITGPNGVVTATAAPDPNAVGANAGGKNVAAIVAGVIAGVFFLVACYFAFCAWVYRRQLQLYKNHVAMAQRAAVDPARAEKEGFMMPSGTSGSGKNSSDQTQSGDATSSSHRGRRARGVPGPGTAGAGVDNIAYLGPGAAMDGGYTSVGRTSSDSSSTEDLLSGQEPSFWGTHGVLLNPRRSLRVINRD